MKIKCPYCGQEYEVDQSILGCKAQCEKCNSTFVVQPMDNGAAHGLKENRMGFMDLLRQRRETLLEEERKKQEQEEEERKRQEEEERKRQQEAAIAPHPLRGRETAWKDDYVRGQLVLRGKGNTLDSEGALLRPFAVSLGIAPDHFAVLEQEVSFYDEQSNSEILEMMLGMLKQGEEVACFLCDMARLHGEKYAFEGEFLELWRDVCMGLFQIDSSKRASLELLCTRLSLRRRQRQGDDFGDIPQEIVQYYLTLPQTSSTLGNGRYLVIDLSGGANATQYPVRTTDEAPKVAENGCKTSELWLRRIPAGTFTMGSPENELGRFNNEKQHQVTLTQDFYIGVFPCTQRQYVLVMGDNPSYFQGDDRPVEQVSYDDLRGTDKGSKWPGGTEVDEKSFFGRLQAKTRLAFDLPTEAEWEYACRAGTTTSLNSGKDITSERDSCRNLDAVGWYGKNSGGSSHPVGQKQPNEWGLYDMHGNVWEWCLDWNGDYPNASVEDPQGAQAGENRVIRGSTWGNIARYCRSACRNCFKPSLWGRDIGFRVALRP